MKLADAIALMRASDVDYFETYNLGTPVPTAHPPSLKNPTPVKQDLPTDGWKKGDPEELRKRAMADMAIILQRVCRQIGKPEVAHTAQLPFGSYWMK